MDQINIQLPDGSKREYPAGVTGFDIAKSIGEGLARQTVAARIDDVVCDVTTVINSDARVELITLGMPEGLDVYRHTVAHVMAHAVKDIYGAEVQVTIGPAIKNGFYYDFYCENQVFTPEDFAKSGVRVVPNAVARHGSYIALGVVLMPSFVNIGGYVDSGTMVDTWASVGSCAQIGKNVHLSGGVGIGGVLEPLQAGPTIIEDNCFIGARSEIVEGVVVEEGAVISMGVYIGQSTKIYNRMTGEIIFGRVPAGSVVVPGNLPSKDGAYSLYCAVIIKQVDEKTRSKTGLNELLRD